MERSLLYGFQSIGGGIENDHEEGIVVVLVLVIKARCVFLSTRPSWISIEYNILKRERERERERDRNSPVWANRFIIRVPGHPGLVNGSLLDGFLEDWDSLGF